MSKRDTETKYKRNRFTPLCRNCGARVASDYCPDCGQKITAGSEKTVWTLIANAADSLFSWDSKIFVTLKYLLFYPGRLTKDYYAGRISRYVYPTKLFWFLTIIFFAIVVVPVFDTMTDEENETLVFKQNEQQEMESENLRDDIKSSGVDPDILSGSVAESVELLDSLNIADDADDSGEEVEILKRSDFLVLIKAYLPYTVFALIPFFALLLYIFFFKRRSYYANHVIFALHFHSFIFIMVLVFSIIKKLLPGTEPAASAVTAVYSTLYTVVPVLYFVLALHNAYGASYKRLVLVVPAIMLLYLVAILVITICFFLLVIWLKEPSLFSK